MFRTIFDRLTSRPEIAYVQFVVMRTESRPTDTRRRSDKELQLADDRPYLTIWFKERVGGLTQWHVDVDNRIANYFILPDHPVEPGDHIDLSAYATPKLQAVVAALNASDMPVKHVSIYRGDRRMVSHRLHPDGDFFRVYGWLGKPADIAARGSVQDR